MQRFQLASVVFESWCANALPECKGSAHCAQNSNRFCYMSSGGMCVGYSEIQTCFLNKAGACATKVQYACLGNVGFTAVIQGRRRGIHPCMHGEAMPLHARRRLSLCPCVPAAYLKGDAASAAISDEYKCWGCCWDPHHQGHWHMIDRCSWLHDCRPWGRH